MDKGEVVRAAAQGAVKAIIKLFPPESTRTMFRTLESLLETGKWRSKIGVLEAFKPFVTSSTTAVAAELGAVLPKVEHAMHDTKQEVREWRCTERFFSSSVGINCCRQMCNFAMHHPCQSRSRAPHTRSRQMYGQPRFRACLYQGTIIDDVRSRSNCSRTCRARTFAHPSPE